MSIKVVPKIAPEQELSQLAQLLPDGAQKREVLSHLKALDNINKGFQPDGSPFPDGIPNTEDTLAKYVTSNLIEQGFDVVLGGNKSKDTSATKKFLISAVKNGEHVDVGSLVAQLLPEDAKKLLSKVLQTDIVGKDIFQLKDTALKRVKEIESQIKAAVKVIEDLKIKALAITEKFGKLPDVANATTAIIAISDTVNDLSDKAQELVGTLEDDLAEQEAAADSDTPPEDNPDTTTPPEDTPSPEDIPPTPPDTVLQNTPPPPIPPDDSTSDPTYTYEEEEEDLGVIYDD